MFSCIRRVHRSRGDDVTRSIDERRLSRWRTPSMSLMVHVCYILVGPSPNSTCSSMVRHRRRPLLFINQARQPRPPSVGTLCSLTKSRVSIHRCNRLQKLKRKKTSTRGYPRRRRQSPGEYNPNRSLYAVILIAHTEVRTPQLSKQSPPPTTRPVRPRSRYNPTARAPRPTLSHPIRSKGPQNPREIRRR